MGGQTISHDYGGRREGKMGAPLPCFQACLLITGVEVTTEGDDDRDVVGVGFISFFASLGRVRKPHSDDG